MMDFGTKPEPMRPEIKTGSKKRFKKFKLAILLPIIVVLGGLAFYWLYIKDQNANPLPDSLKNQISYKVVYPTSKTGTVDKDSYQYQVDQKTLTYSFNSAETKIVFIEQPAPASLGTGNQVYFPAIGVHPYAQFQSKLGPVALTKFYQSGSLKSAGQSAILVAEGTMVIAHPNQDLTNTQWKVLFDGLKIAK
ncbi:hypothetical protein KW801_01410 [Candidatus Saccharibacteria bacterium]|nr:hypothetical protein [Candidatus Saccharibacteria bacterium]